MRLTYVLRNLTTARQALIAKPPLSTAYLPGSKSLALSIIMIIAVAIGSSLQPAYADDAKGDDMLSSGSRDSDALGPSDDNRIFINLSSLSGEALALAYAFKTDRDAYNNMDKHYKFLKKMRDQFIVFHEKMLPKLTAGIDQYAANSNPNTPGKVFAQNCAVLLRQLSLLINVLMNESQYLLDNQDNNVLVKQCRIGVESVYKRLEILDKSVQTLRKDVGLESEGPPRSAEDSEAGKTKDGEKGL